jgi:hypothetical protein
VATALFAIVSALDLAILCHLVAFVPFLLFLGRLSRYAGEERLSRRTRLLIVMWLVWPVMIAASTLGFAPGGPAPRWLGGSLILGGLLVAFVAAVSYLDLLWKLSGAVLRRAGLKPSIWM